MKNRAKPADTFPNMMESANPFQTAQERMRKTTGIVNGKLHESRLTKKKHLGAFLWLHLKLFKSLCGTLQWWYRHNMVVFYG